MRRIERRKRRNIMYNGDSKDVEEADHKEDKDDEKEEIDIVVMVVVVGWGGRITKMVDAAADDDR